MKRYQFLLLHEFTVLYFFLLLDFNIYFQHTFQHMLIKMNQVLSLSKGYQICGPTDSLRWEQLSLIKLIYFW